MPDYDNNVPMEDDDEDYTSLLASPGGQKFAKSIAVPPSPYKPQTRASTVVSPFENISASTSVSQSPQLSINEHATFVDEHLQTETLEKWFTNFATSFCTQIFPQFFIKTLSTEFSELLSSDEAFSFTQNCSTIGDLDDNSIRDITYNATSDLLYKTLQKKIIKRPSLIYEFIAALRVNNWYQALADMFESELNSWKKQMIVQINAATPAFALPSPAAPGPALVVNSNGQIAQAYMPMAVLSQPVGPSRPTSLLVNLPEPLSFFVPRPKKAKDLIDHLLSVSKVKDAGKNKVLKGGWIILYGMGGSGKTTMAASTVRLFYEKYPDKFTDGIFWLHIGQLSEKANNCSNTSINSSASPAVAAVDNQQNQLLLKMELLAELLRPFSNNAAQQQVFSTTKFDQIPTAKHRLKSHFENHTKSLLILDDVWSTDVLENFNFAIPVLVTTRVKSIVPKSFFNIVPVSIYAKDKPGSSESGEVLLLDEAMGLLYNCLNLPTPNELVKMEHLQGNCYVRDIIRNFKGLPFCIPLVANCMEPFYQIVPHTDVGLRYKLDLENENAEKDEDEEDFSKVPCFEDWKQLHANIVLSASNLNADNRNSGFIDLGTHELVKASIASLDENLKMRLYDFVIFPEAVPFRVFQTFWSDLGQPADVKIMNILEQLVNKSLVIKIINYNTLAAGQNGRPGSPRGKGGASVPSPAAAASFTLHSITLAFLRSELKRDEIKERHCRLIERYLEKYCRTVYPRSHCEYDYSRLPDDQYIYHNLAYHLYSAERWTLFAPIFLNLRFATHKIRQVGPSDLLNDYIDYRRYFERADSKKLNDYHSFIASNSNILCEPNVDIIQIALNQPNTSAVYTEAKALVDQLAKQANIKNEIFFDWCNKANCCNEGPPKLLSFKCLPEVSFATYSPDSRYIATASGKTLQLWDGTTGEMICRLDDQHHEQINHAVFSRSGQYLLTSGDDGVAIMWANTQWTPPKLQSSSTDLSSSLNYPHQNTHRNSRSLTVGAFDYIDSGIADNSEHSTLSSFPSSSGLSGSIDNLTLHPSSADVEADLLTLRQRRRRSSGNNSGPYANSSLGVQSLLTRVNIFDLKLSKLKADTIVETSESRKFKGALAGANFGASGPSLAHSIRCSDISSDNRYVLTGNGTANLHLWSVAENQQIIFPLLLVSSDSGFIEGVEGDDCGGREVECCAFSGDSRFILGLVANVVYIFSVNDKTRSQTELHVIGKTASSNANSNLNRNNGGFRTPPGSPRQVRRDQISVTLSHRLVHKYKVYNAIFHSSGSNYYPFVFTSSDKYIFEWDLDVSRNNGAQASSFLDFDETENDNFQAKNNSMSGVKLTQEKRKYSTTLSSAHSQSSSHSSHISFVAVSRSGNRIAGFEHTRNEIYLWNRGDEAANWGFGSRSPSPVSGGCCPSNVLLRCQANIVALAFSNDSERLLGCCRSGEVTVWNVGTNVSKSSIVDLKDKFAVTFADKTNDESVCVLTIDTKGFLRLFTGLAGDEDRQFSLDMRHHLSTYHETVRTTSKNLMPVSPLRLNITCCDIAPSGDILMGTNAAEVFYYKNETSSVNGETTRRLLRQIHGVEASPEIVNHVHFVPGTSTHFISISDTIISFFAYEPPQTSTTNSPSFIKRNISLHMLIEHLNQKAGALLDNNNNQTNAKIEFFQFVPSLSWLVFWSNFGHFFVFNYADNYFVYETYLNNALITCVDFSAASKTTVDNLRRQVMVVATSSKLIYTFRITESSSDGVQVTEGPILLSKVIPRSCRVAPDKTFIVVGDDTGGLCRRSTNTRPMGAEVWRVVNAHSAWVNDLLISPCQRFIISASESVKLWNALDGSLLQAFMTHGSVSRLLARFPFENNNNQNVNNEFRGRTPKVTVVTVTDASTLYILRTLP